MVGAVIGIIVEGLLFGAFLRALLPGEQNWTIGQTVVVGAIAWWIVGFFLRAVFGAVATFAVWLALMGAAAWVMSRRRRPLTR